MNIGDLIVMKQFYALATAVFLYALFCLSIDYKFGADFMHYLVDN